MLLTSIFLDFSSMDLSAVNQTQSSNSTCYKYLYKALKIYFLQWYLPLVIMLGFAGSIFCIIFLNRSDMFQKNIRIWLTSICIGDFLILAMEGIWMLLKVWYEFDLRDVNDTLCILHTSLSNYLFYWSAYVQCFVSMQRCYLVLKPLEVNAKFLSPKYLLLCLLLVSVFLVLPILPYAIYWRVIDGDCDPLNDDIFHLTTVFDLVFWGLIPVILMATSTIIIWRNLLQRRNLFDSLGNFKPGFRISTPDSSNDQSKKSVIPKRHSVALCRIQAASDTRTRSKSIAKFLISDPSSSPSKRFTITPIPMVISGSGSNTQKRRLNSDGNSHVTLLLICMNFVYMASVYPLIIYFICLNFIFESLDKDIHRFIYYLFRSFCFLNACTNWIFYCVAGSTFRRRTRRLVRLICARVCGCGSRPHSVNPVPPPTYPAQWSDSARRFSCAVYQPMSSRGSHISLSNSLPSNSKQILTDVVVKSNRA